MGWQAGVECRSAQDLLAELLDGELGRDESARVREHLERCADCSARLEFASRLRAATRAAAAEGPASDAIRRRLLERLAGEEPRVAAVAAPPRRKRGWPVWPAARVAAAVVALLSTVGLVLSWESGGLRQDLVEDHLACWSGAPRAVNAGGIPGHAGVPPSLELAGGRWCLQQEMGVQVTHSLLLHGPEKRRVSLYAFPSGLWQSFPGPLERQPRMMEGMAVWYEGTYIYVLVGDQDVDLLQVAQSFNRRCERKER